MEITLDDIFAFEPHLVVPSRSDLAGPRLEGWGQASVSWAVSTRPIPPHLPPLRGGELVLVPARAVAELGNEVPALLREARLLKASAAVLPADWFESASALPDLAGFPLLGWIGEMTIDTETSINRRLTECRGELYRIGSELERQLADVAAAGASLEATVEAAAIASGLPVKVLDASGRRLAAAADAEPIPDSHAGEDHCDDVRHDLAAGASLVLGPIRRHQRVRARFVLGRIAGAVNAALRRDAMSRPRGARRQEALESLLAMGTKSQAEHRPSALALGLDPDGVHVVAVSRGAGEGEMSRALSPLGAVYLAGAVDGLRTGIVAVNPALAENDAMSRAMLDVKKRWTAAHEQDGAILALSAPTRGVERLPMAAREARTLASLQARTSVPRLAASFESIDDLGVLRLLYELRDSAELRRFVERVLGELERGDQRGTLRRTLRAFLESGGSHVEAAHVLGIHRNTLTYRLRRIGELVGHDLHDHRSWLPLHLALYASELIQASDDEREPGRGLSQ